MPIIEHLAPHQASSSRRKSRSSAARLRGIRVLGSLSLALDPDFRRDDVRLYAIFIFLIGTLLFNVPALAQTDACNLSKAQGLAGSCPAGAIGASTANNQWQGARMEPNSTAQSAIDAFGYCRYLSNTGDTFYFVPLASEEEWRGFISNHPRGATFATCSRGGLVPVPPNFGQGGASNQCVTSQPVQSVLTPYKPASVAAPFVAPPVTYACQSMDGTAFTETATATFASRDSGYGPDNVIGWDVTKILYTFDGVCGAAKGVITATAPTHDLCHVGVPSAVIGTGPFTWICSGGSGGGKNVSCSSGIPCEKRIVEQKPCKCEDGNCYRPVFWSDGCGHTGIDKSQRCEKAEPLYQPSPPNPNDN